MQMGLSFATFFDPSGGPNMPVLARLLNLLAMLLFLSFDGHLWLISLLADSFHTLPIQTQPLNGNGFGADPSRLADLHQRHDAGAAADLPAVDAEHGARRSTA